MEKSERWEQKTQGKREKRKLDATADFSSMIACPNGHSQRGCANCCKAEHSVQREEEFLTVSCLPLGKVSLVIYYPELLVAGLAFAGSY